MLSLLKICLIFTFALLQIVLIPVATAKPIRQYMEIEREDLKMLLGEKLYNQPGGGCWSCHGTKGMKLDGVSDDTKKKHQNIADLRNPATWTSFKIIKEYTGKSEMLFQRDISLSLVRLGADEWNKELAPLIREYTGSNVIFFDEQMIGIHSKFLKKNARSVSRTLKREKVKFKGRDIMDIMATSVFFYIEKKFVGNK